MSAQSIRAYSAGKSKKFSRILTDGRVLGKMGRSERIGADLCKNVPGSYNSYLFESAVQSFRGN